MSSSRSYAELMGLEMEAERLVRMGESRAEVSRRLGVHPMTLAGWALRGGWRKKDLDMERATEATRATILAIRRGNTAVDAERRLRAEVARVLRAALEVSRQGGDEALAQALKLVEQAPEMTRVGRWLEPKPGAELSRVTLAPDPKAAGMGSLGDADVNRPGFGEVVNFDTAPDFDAPKIHAPKIDAPEIDREDPPPASPDAHAPRAACAASEAEALQAEMERLAAAGELEAAYAALEALERLGGQDQPRRRSAVDEAGSNGAVR